MTVVSVVTPFHNTAEYLAECIESVLAQTLGDFEYVLLDNCSTDGSGEIAERYARADPRVRFHRNEALLAQVPNFNRALTLICGESRYTKLVQADDGIYPRCLEEMVALADAHPSVGVVGSYFHHGTIDPADMPYLPQVLSGRDACRKRLLDGIFLFGSPSVVLVRSDIVRSRVPFFEEGRLHEDTEAYIEILRDHDFGFVPQILSFLRRQANSIGGATATFHPYQLDRLIRLRRYGREFLTEDEYRRESRHAERQYWQTLSRAWVMGREPAFWDYHRRGLATAGEEITRGKLARHAALDALRYLRARWREAGALLRRATGRAARPGEGGPR